MKKLILNIILLTSMIFSFKAFSQSEFQSPEVYQFQSHDILPPNLYSGKVNVTVPIFTVKSGNISVPIELNYNTGGIKVAQASTNVGLGWSLRAGGNIVKTVKDFDDMRISFRSITEYNGACCPPTTSIVAENVGWHRRNPYRIERSDSSQDLYLATRADITKLDSHPDIFNVNAPGLFGKFFFENVTPESQLPTTPYANYTYEAKVLEANNFKVNTTNTTRESFNVFGFPEYWDTPIVNGYTFEHGSVSLVYFKDIHLSANNGLDYFFEKNDIVESAIRAPLSENVLYGGYTASLTDWHLTRIVDKKTDKEVTFNYEEYQLSTSEEFTNVYSSYGNAYYNIYDPPSDCTLSPVHQAVGILPKSHIENNYLKYPKTNRVSSINYDNGSVEFVYGLNRDDRIGDKALTEILIKDFFGNTIEKYKLYYAYFNSKETICNEPSCKRLKLLRIEKVDENQNIIPWYSFEYNESHLFPRRSSLQTDYLGYYNNNGIDNDWFGIQWYETELYSLRPKLYYHPNHGKHSVLPFNLSSSPSFFLNGEIDLSPNNYALTGILEKVIFPTGGYREFEYETHDFEFQGNVISAGGARIKKQILNNGTGDTREFIYEYVNESGNSSGSVNNLPTYGRPKFAFPNNNVSALNVNNTAFAVFNVNQATVQLTDGAYVGYSRIIEKELGNGYTVYEYNAPNNYSNIDAPRTVDTSLSDGYLIDCVDFYINNSDLFSAYQDRNILQGTISKKTIYDENSNLLLEESYDYTYEEKELIDLTFKRRWPAHYRYGTPFGPEFYYGKMIINNKLFVERNLLTSNIKKVYGNFDYTNSNDLFTQYQYDPNYPLLIEQKTINNVKELKTKFYYPFSSEISSNPYMSNLMGLNRLSTPIITENYLVRPDGSEKLISKNKSIYKIENSLILPEFIQASKGVDDLETRMKYHKYDNKGNPLETSKADGTRVVYIWGYNQTQIIAKIENLSYTTMPSSVLSLISSCQAASNSDDDTTIDVINADESITPVGNEGQLRLALRNLQNALPNSSMTSFTYNPLIGLTSTIDPKSDIKYYEYDSFNRLKHIKDKNGNILSKNEYNYKN